MGTTRSRFRFGLVAVLGTAMGGCAPASIRANLDTPAQGPPGALSCATVDQPMDTLTVGASGGLLTANGHNLRIPAGALTENEEARFTIVHPPRDFVVVSVTPHGKRFDVPATLELSYAHCPERDVSLAVYRWGGQDGWVKLDSDQDRSRAVVAVELQSLSSYALGAN